MYTRFWAPNCFGGGLPNFGTYRVHYKTWTHFWSRGKVHGDRPTQLGETSRGEKKTSAVKHQTALLDTMPGNLKTGELLFSSTLYRPGITEWPCNRVTDQNTVQIVLKVRNIILMTFQLTQTGQETDLHDEVSEQCKVNARPAVEQAPYLNSTQRSLMLTLHFIDALSHLLHGAQRTCYDVVIVAMVMTQHVLRKQQASASTILLWLTLSLMLNCHAPGSKARRMDLTETPQSMIKWENDWQHTGKSPYALWPANAKGTLPRRRGEHFPARCRLWSLWSLTRSYRLRTWLSAVRTVSKLRNGSG